MKKKFKLDKLTRLKGKIRTFKIASYDIETYGEYNYFLLGGFIDSRGKYKSFTDKEEMILYMQQHVDKDTLVYATRNSFDHYALFGHRKEFFEVKPLMRGNLLIHATFNNIETYDTKAYSKATVEQLGEMLGKPKGSMNVTKNTEHMLDKPYTKRMMIKYNKRDCEITREFVIKLQELLNGLGGTLKSTIGGCAMDLFRRKYLDEDITHEYQKEFKDGMKIKDFLKYAYHGGRTEMFKRGYDDTHIWRIYDVNSLYPSVMLNEFPNPSSAQLTEHKFGKLNISSILNYDGVSDCEVVCPHMYYPVLSTFVNKKLCFLIGKFRDVFTHVELRKALEKGYKITKIYKTIAYTKNIKPFTRWINELYNIRLEYQKSGNKIFSDLTKLILNNLYGKFFQSKIKDFELLHLDKRNDKDLKQEGYTFDYKIGFGYRETPKESNQLFITPIFSVYTTAYARLKIYDKIVESNAVYCDTDSVFTTAILPTSDKLGEFKLEYESPILLIGKQKHYRTFNTEKGKSIDKIKGVFLSKEKSERDIQFENSLNGTPITQKRVLSIKEAIIRGGKPNQMIYMTKKINLHDDKRVWIKEFDRNIMQDSQPLISGFDNVEDLMNYYNSLP